MSNKKKVIIASITMILILVGGFFFKNYNKKVASTNTRVVQDNVKKGSVDVKFNKEKDTINKQDKKDKKEENKKEIKKKEIKKKEEKKNNRSDKSEQKKSIVKSSKNEEIGSEVTVNLRIEGYEKTFLPRTSITTRNFDLNAYLSPATGSSATPSKGWGVDKFKSSNNAHAIIKALSKIGYKKGVNYDFQDYGWGLYMAMIGGDREFDHRSTSGWMYRVNNILPNVGCQGRPIQNGDEILWYFGAYGFDTLVTEMKLNKTNFNVGETVTVTLNGIKNDVNTWKEYREPAKGAIIYANGQPLVIKGKKAITDDSGKANIKFDKSGTYTLSAERINASDIRDIVRPRPITIRVK